MDVRSNERTWENACPECGEPVWLRPGDIVVCEVTELGPFGIRVEVAPEIEGLIHISELGENIRSPDEIVTLGQQIKALVIGLDPWERRIGLSLKRVASV